MNLILYCTATCELCDKAEQLVHRTLEGTDYQLVHVDITRSFELKKQYGLRIPVLALADDKARVLYWPFDAQHILELAANG